MGYEQQAGEAFFAKEARPFGRPAIGYTLSCVAGAVHYQIAQKKATKWPLSIYFRTSGGCGQRLLADQANLLKGGKWIAGIRYG
jgi:hypothetical protein